MSNKELSKEDRLVFIQKYEAFTNSKIIAECAKVQHGTIRRITDKYKSDFEEFGKIRFMDFKSINLKGGRPEKIYLYNEQQVTLLLTYLKNTLQVREFKKELVRQFYKAKKRVEELKSPAYKAIRTESKETTKNSMKLINSSISNIKSTDYIKANTIANKATSLKFGLKKMVKVEYMTSEMLLFRDEVLKKIASLMQAKALGVKIPHISEIIYKNI